MRFQDKIINLRKTNRWSQEELAGRLNVSRQAISRWESGTALPDAINIVQLSKLFGVTTDYLLNKEYESDLDLPLLQSMNDESSVKISRIISICITVLGFSGNLIIYILSRAIEVTIPFITYKGGEKFSSWSPDYKGRSYRYFIQEYELGLLTVFFWLLLILGLVALFIPKKKLLSILDTLGISGKKPKKNK